MGEDAMDVAQAARTQAQVLASQVGDVRQDLREMREALNRHTDATNTGLRGVHERIDRLQRSWWGALLAALASFAGTLIELILKVH